VSDVLADLPADVPPLELPPSALVLAATGRSGGVVEGERGRVRFEELGLRIAFEAAPVLEIDGTPLGPVANVVQSPGLIRRERIGSAGAVTEAVLIAPTIPLAWIQWRPAPAATIPSVHLHPLGAWATSGDASDRTVLLRNTEGAAPHRGDLLAVWVTGPATLTVDGESVLRLTMQPAPDATDAITLVVAHGDERALRGARAAALHTPAHARRAASGPDEGLTLRTGVAEIDEGIAWARARLPAISRPGRLLPALAALSSGDTKSARDAHAALSPASAESIVLAARIAATTGDPSAAMACASLLDSASDPLGSDLGATAAVMLADGLRYAAPEARIDSLRRLGAELRARGSTPSRSGRSLPMAGASAAPHPAATGPWIASLMDGKPGAGAPPPEAVARCVSELRMATAAFPTRPDEAWSTWRAALSAGLEGGPAGPATWDDPETVTESITAELILALTHGLLGIGQDAPVGRLRLAPRLPGHIDRFVVDGIGIGDARLKLSYHRDGATHQYEVLPVAAGVPPLVVFEPSVAGSVESVRVDGAAADLEVRLSGARSIVPVQLPVDGVRTLEVVTREG
jgi:hypothetical protein